ncbi:hypothetical protein G6R29_05180 [Fructobacillus sp. M2-14]|uniref:Uncharacterized protein n=1 Tax=Fructobacillus broussonetiae TaxID=2713173 RepID=A0ABS5R4D3_9LACO|nr:hypothetical protein [Fructobacillus broussonetiae]MBS9339012.1 hypothetical protein [Fructobacillus broussonetiae]
MDANRKEEAGLDQASFNTEKDFQCNVSTHPEDSGFSDYLMKQTAIQTALFLRKLLLQELEDKAYLRKHLISAMMGFFVIVTTLVFFIVLFVREGIHLEIQKCLIIGLFGNLFGLLMVLYRYAFSDTEKIMKNINNLLH